MWLKEVSHMDRESGAKGRSGLMCTVGGDDGRVYSGHHNRRAVPGVLMSKLSPESAVGKRNTEHMEGVCRSLEQKLAEVSDVVLLVVEGKKVMMMMNHLRVAVPRRCNCIGVGGSFLQGNVWTCLCEEASYGLPYECLVL